ncbi:hypothetical protein LSH36_454g03037 [Paralvinella palmiformis]|uniref:C2H2-type domain-containing protein n=1 Tax=Paralvinella palmiformis TaxID=53620 RepID=A0AAD9MXT5_9ANNE|nr:hypothetical protein LSH36_454g03037 [Paralvinella palmiformis]
MLAPTDSSLEPHRSGLNQVPDRSMDWRSADSSKDRKYKDSGTSAKRADGSFGARPDPRSWSPRPRVSTRREADCLTPGVRSKFRSKYVGVIAVSHLRPQLVTDATHFAWIGLLNHQKLIFLDWGLRKNPNSRSLIRLFWIMGVLITVRVHEGKTFGPIPANLTLTDPTLLIGHMTSDNRPDVHTVKIDIHEYASGTRLAEWLPYVQAARDEHEQNLEALIQNGQLYYRFLKTVPPHGELLVWYSEDLARIIGVPQLNEVHYNDNGTYCCPYCAQNFRYPNSLRAHLRFKCDILKKAMHMDTPFRSTMDIRVPYSVYNRNMSSASGTITNLSPNGSMTSLDDSSSPPRHCRSPDLPTDAEEGQPKRMRVEPEGERERKCTPSPKRQEVGETRSAFRKVERTGCEPHDRELLKGHPLGLLSCDVARKSSTIAPPGGPLPSAFPLSMIPAPFLSPLSVARIQNENVPIQNGADYQHRLADKLTQIQNAENNNVFGKMAAVGGYPARRLGFYPSFFKSSNPMVDKIINHNLHIPSSLTSFSLAQNWCAKCNTTFRMTSDLVYHMRSHHKREFDPLKRKREEKLRCDICGETFKERHHLSRHMTSHV